MRATGIRFVAIAVVLTSALFATPAMSQPQTQPQTQPDFSARIIVHADNPKATISREIYGHFAEHLGRLIYDGIWVGPDSKIPNTRGMRNDIVEALKKINIPVLRWPGGCFADEYHWRDGIGPRDQRPKRINTHWGMVIETNAFGTHEFLDLCEQLGCEAYICGNVGSGTPQELMEWVEYMTSDSDSTLANLRRQNGREKPWTVKYVGVGNESWGCGGNMTPEYYANEYRRYQTFVKNYPGSSIQKIACGANGPNYQWTDTVMQRVGNRMMNGISVHWYTVPSDNWNNKGPATGFPTDQWHSTVAGAWRIEEIINKHLEVMDKYDPGHRVGLVVDEWGNWYDQEPGSHPGFLYQQNTLRDAVTAGITLNIFNNHCDRVTMANIAQMVNVLQALILTDGEKMILTPTYHVFEMYKVHQGATLLATEATSPDYQIGKNKLPSISTSASKDRTGRIHLSVVNALPDQGANLELVVKGRSARKLTGRILAAEAIDAHNSFDAPQTLQPHDLPEAAVNGDIVSVTIPAKSVAVLQLE